MKKIFFICIIFYSLSTTALSQSVFFTKGVKGQGSAGAYCIDKTSDNGFILAGTDLVAGIDFQAPIRNLYYAKLDSSGNLVWSKWASDGTQSTAYSVHQTSNGGYIICCNAYNASWGDNFIMVVETDANGNVIWHTLLNDSPAYAEYAYSIVESNDGCFVLVGSTAFGNKMLLVKLTDQLNLLWSKVYVDSSYTSAGYDLQQTPDSGFIICGTTDYLSPFLMKTDSVGNIQWSKIYHGQNLTVASSLDQTFDGGYVIAGSQEYSNSIQSFVIKTDINGDTLWTRVYSSTNEIYLSSIRETADSGFILCGKWKSGINQKGLLMKTNKMGNTLWARTSDNLSWGIRNGDAFQTFDNGYAFAGSPNLLMSKTDTAGQMPGCDNQENIMDLPGDFITVSNASLIDTVGNIFATSFLFSSGDGDTTRIENCSSVLIPEISDTQPEIHISPNPAGNFLDVKTDLKIWLLEIIDTYGRIVCSHKLEEEFNIQFDLSGLGSGLYFLRSTGESEIWTNKFIKY